MANNLNSARIDPDERPGGLTLLRNRASDHHNLAPKVCSVSQPPRPSEPYPSYMSLSPGFMNKHGQLLLNNHTKSDSGDYVCELGCSVCSHLYTVPHLHVLDCHCPRCHSPSSDAPPIPKPALLTAFLGVRRPSRRLYGEHRITHSPCPATNTNPTVGAASCPELRRVTPPAFLFQAHVPASGSITS